MTDVYCRIAANQLDNLEARRPRAPNAQRLRAAPNAERLRPDPRAGSLCTYRRAER